MKMQSSNYLLLFLLLGAFWGNSQKVNAQTEVIKPLLLDKSVLSGVGLDTITLKNEPERAFFQKRLFRGKDISIYVVSSESWTVPFDAFWFDEFIYILNGKARVESEHYADQYFSSREYFFAPKGFKGAWEVQAGKQLHYELSVITNRRADSTQVSQMKHPYAFDQTTLSGLDVQFDSNGLYEKVLADGIELKVKFRAESPQKRKLDQVTKEQLICLLSGQLTLEDSKGDQYTFYTGDFIVIPDGFTGNWESQGHGMIKFLTVEKA